MAEPRLITSDRLFADWRLALRSMLAFWGIYLLTVILRASFSGDPVTIILNRSWTIVFGFVLTMLIYAAIVRFAYRSTWRRRAIIGMIAAFIAACAQSGMLIVSDRYMEKPDDLIQVVSEEGYTITDTGQTSKIERPGKEPITITYPKIDKLKPWYQFRAAADGAVVWFFFFAAWAAFYLALVSQARAHQLRNRAAAAEKAAQSAQIRALRYQVNPHFLFNTLNSLSSLVMTGRTEKAEDMLLKLSTFFRSSLSLDPSADVTLAEEIDLQKLYLDIEMVRFPTRLNTVIDVPDDVAHARLPALILQPLVENAIKYGVSKTRDKIILTIKAERIGEKRLSLRVTNTGKPEDGGRPVLKNPVEEHGTGVGIANVCQRLEARYGGLATCDFGPRKEGGYEVHLTLPLDRHHA
jgi:hypothetical protein